MHTAEPLVPEPSSFKLAIAIENVERHKLPGFDQIPAELMQAADSTLYAETHKVFSCIWNKEELPQQWKECLCKKGKKLTVVSTEGCHCYQLRTNCI
jgi:hypothetical protein